MRAHLGLDLFGKTRAPISHRQQHRRHAQAGIEIRPYALNSRPELAQPLERVVLGLDRDQHLIRGDHDIESHQPQRRGAVDQDDIDVVARVEELTERIAQEELPPLDIDQLDLGPRQVDCGRADADPLDIRARPEDLLDGGATDNDIVSGQDARVVRDTERAGRVPLRIGVDDDDIEATECESSGHIDRRRRFADAALLIGDGDSAGALRTAEGRVIQHLQVAQRALDLAG